MLPWQRKSIFVMRVLYHSFMLDIFVPPPPLPRREESGLGVRRRKCRKRHFVMGYSNVQLLYSDTGVGFFY